MSEGNVPPRSQDADSLRDAQGQLPLEPTHQPAADDDWETIPLMGMPPLSSSNASEMPSSQPVANSAREVELQSRIVDLNQCNEVLLARVNQLEDALERSQQALQQEVERSQRRPDEDKVTAAQTQSVAQLLSELDTANGALKRQTLLAETLTAQLKSAEERADRLEKECAILRKRKSERAKQLQAAEETCADLRSRLQRQQQYTLQFKAALEKCLDTSAFQHTSQSIESAADQPSEVISSAPVTSSQPIGMPRSESIRPWSASPAQLPTDPQLQSLLRSQPAVAEPASSAPSPAANPTETAEPTPHPSADAAPPSAAAGSHAADPPHHAAEQQLWQDVERVIKNTAPADDPAAQDTAEPADSPPPSPTDAAPPPAASETAEFTEPIPWGAPIRSEPPAAAESAPVESPAPAPPPATTTAHQESVTPPSAPSPSPEPPTEAPMPAQAANIPALDAMQTSQKSPSPLVHPLRPPQRKRKSLSAVELPSFPPLPKVNS